CVIRPPQPHVEIAQPVVDRQVDLVLAFVGNLEDLEIGLNRLLPFLTLLVPACFVLELADGLHASCGVRSPSLSTSTRRCDSSRCAVSGDSLSRSAAAPHSSASGSMPTISVCS